MTSKWHQNLEFGLYEDGKEADKNDTKMTSKWRENDTKVTKVFEMKKSIWTNAYVFAGDVDGRFGGIGGVHVEEFQFTFGFGGHQEARAPDDTFVTGHHSSCNQSID